MRKEYLSPDLEIVKLRLQDVLAVSKDEVIASGGDIEEPDPEMIDGGL